MTKQKIKEPEELGLEVYNEKQQFYVNVKENCELALKNFEDSIKLQKDILEMAEAKIKELDG